jgi:MFS family permease
MIIVISLTAGSLTVFGARLDKLALLRVAPFIHAGEFIVFLAWHSQMWHAYLAVGIGGLGAGILIAWLPATAANAAPPDKTASLVGLITLGRVVGTAVGSAVFAVVLATVGRSSGTAAALSGYLVVFTIALASSLVGGAVLAAAARPAGDRPGVRLGVPPGGDRPEADLEVPAPGGRPVTSRRNRRRPTPAQFASLGG